MSNTAKIVSLLLLIPISISLTGNGPEKKVRPHIPVAFAENFSDVN